MRETRVAALVLGAAAAATFALAAALVRDSITHHRRPVSAPVGTIAAVFEAVPMGGTIGAGDLQRLLPAKTPRTRVLERLAADGFACTFEFHAATCFRPVGAGRATSIWTLWLTFDNAETLTSSQGERRTPRP